MEEDSEMYHDVKSKVEDPNIGNKLIEDIENNPNILNNSPSMSQIKEGNVNIETLEVSPQKIENRLDNIYNISEKDNLSHHSELSIETEEPIFFCNKISEKSKLIAILDDSKNEEKSLYSSNQNEEHSSGQLQSYESDNDLKSEDNESKIETRERKRIANIDSDSEEENNSNMFEKLLNREEVEGDDIHLFEANKDLLEVEVQSVDQKKILSTLCDSESSDENSNENGDEHVNTEQISDSEVDALQANVILPSKSRKSKSKVKSNIEKPEKMTAKKALEQKKEIFSESQRRIRESRISLPYHKPKPRSLKEFLENRPKLSSALTNVHNASSPSAAIKMSLEQLVIVSKKLKEREKEVQQFYKSESESENEDTPIDSDAVKQETETNICNDNTEPQSETGEKNDISEIDTLDQYDVNNVAICTHTDITDNMEQLEMRNLDTIPKFDKIEDVSFTVLNKNIDENTENHTFNSEEINNMNEMNNPDDTSEDQNVKEKSELMNISDCQNIAAGGLMEQMEEKEIESSIQKETELIDQLKDQVVVMPTVDNIEVEKQKDDFGSVTEESQFESGKPEKLIILSDIILKPSNSEKHKDFYSLDDELSDLASELKKNNQESENYDFNLDDIEDDFERSNEDINETKVEKLNNNSDQLQKNRKQQLLEKLGSLKPRLSGGPNEIIDLENGLTMPDEVSKLRERFLQHNIKLGKHKHKKKISILSVTDGKICKETLALNVDDDDDEESTVPLEKPGVRLQKLREELEHQMAQKRSDIWKEKLNQTNKSKVENDGETDDENSNCGVDNILDNDEEEEFTESEEVDDELEENDCDMSEKEKAKSVFVEDEAEESDLEEDETEESQFKENCEEIDQMNEKILEEENEDADAEDNVEMEELEDDVPKKRVLKRIITPFDNDDSDDDNDGVTQKKHIYPFLCDSRNAKKDSDDEFLPPQQPTLYKVREPVLTPSKSELDFLTPINYMTGLKNLNTSGSRILPLMSTSSDENVSYMPHKQLSGVTELESQVSDDYFPNTQEVMDTINNRNEVQASSTSDFFKPTEQNVLSSQDVLEICSGNFPSSSKSISSPEISTQQLKEIFTGTDSNSRKSDFNTQDLADICSGQFTGTTPIEMDKYEEIALDEKEENIISQLIDEEELERFKKKFESPVASNTQKTIDFEHAEEVQATGGVIDSEDDDGDELHIKKKKNKKLTFSDESESDSAPEEIIDLHDEDLASNVEYDSEENEIDPEEVETENVQLKPEKLKASDFFENEAELSESEWGSEDEDEKNLDDMEFEKGDEENFDDDKLRSDIERIQMRQMLDDDNREVKLLQELLLEDGELHGAGRQRQFRWKNIDSAGNEAEETKLDDGVYLDDDEESEEQWRRMRHEREMFMLKKQSQEEDSLLIESQRLSFTHKTLKIKSQTSVFSHTESEEAISSPQIKQPFNLLNKRGSFLSRNQQILQKFAEATKVSVGCKSTSRIVFQAVDGELKKRKASTQETDSTPVALKKLRLSHLSPAVQKLKPKVGKSLFSTVSLD